LWEEAWRGRGEAEAGDEEGVGAMARRWKERVKGRREKDAGGIERGQADESG
jgi:hypothetical protein